MATTSIAIGISTVCVESASLTSTVTTKFDPAAGVAGSVAVAVYSSVVPTCVATIGSVMPGTRNFTDVTAMSSVAFACNGSTKLVCAAGITPRSIGQSHVPLGTVGSFTPM